MAGDLSSSMGGPYIIVVKLALLLSLFVGISLSHYTGALHKNDLFRASRVEDEIWSEYIFSPHWSDGSSIRETPGNGSHYRRNMGNLLRVGKKDEQTENITWAPYGVGARLAGGGYNTHRFITSVNASYPDSEFSVEFWIDPITEGYYSSQVRLLSVYAGSSWVTEISMEGEGYISAYHKIPGDPITHMPDGSRMPGCAVDNSLTCNAHPDCDGWSDCTFYKNMNLSAIEKTKEDYYRYKGKAHYSLFRRRVMRDGNVVKRNVTIGNRLYVWEDTHWADFGGREFVTNGEWGPFYGYRYPPLCCDGLTHIVANRDGLYINGTLYEANWCEHEFSNTGGDPCPYFFLSLKQQEMSEGPINLSIGGCYPSFDIYMFTVYSKALTKEEVNRNFMAFIPESYSVMVDNHLYLYEDHNLTFSLRVYNLIFDFYNYTPSFNIINPPHKGQLIIGGSAVKGPVLVDNNTQMLYVPPRNWHGLTSFEFDSSEVPGGPVKAEIGIIPVPDMPRVVSPPDVVGVSQGRELTFSIDDGDGISTIKSCEHLIATSYGMAICKESHGGSDRCPGFLRESGGLMLYTVYYEVLDIVSIHSSLSGGAPQVEDTITLLLTDDFHTGLRVPAVILIKNVLSSASTYSGVEANRSVNISLEGYLELSPREYWKPEVWWEVDSPTLGCINCLSSSEELSGSSVITASVDDTGRIEGLLLYTAGFITGEESLRFRLTALPPSRGFTYSSVYYVMVIIVTPENLAPEVQISKPLVVMPLLAIQAFDIVLRDPNGNGDGFVASVTCSGSLKASIGAPPGLRFLRGDGHFGHETVVTGTLDDLSDSLSSLRVRPYDIGEHKLVVTVSDSGQCTFKSMGVCASTPPLSGSATAIIAVEQEDSFSNTDMSVFFHGLVVLSIPLFILFSGLCSRCRRPKREPAKRAGPEEEEVEMVYLFEEADETTDKPTNEDSETSEALDSI